MSVVSSWTIQVRHDGGQVALRDLTPETTFAALLERIADAVNAPASALTRTSPPLTRRFESYDYLLIALIGHPFYLTQLSFANSLTGLE